MFTARFQLMTEMIITHTTWTRLIPWWSLEPLNMCTITDHINISDRWPICIMIWNSITSNINHISTWPYLTPSTILFGCTPDLLWCDLLTTFDISYYSDKASDIYNKVIRTDTPPPLPQCVKDFVDHHPIWCDLLHISPHRGDTVNLNPVPPPHVSPWSFEARPSSRSFSTIYSILSTLFHLYYHIPSLNIIISVLVFLWFVWII